MWYEVLEVIEDKDTFRVLVENKIRNKRNIVVVAILESTQEICAELLLPDSVEDERTDAIATALCYLEKDGKIENIGEDRWIKK